MNTGKLSLAAAAEVVIASYEAKFRPYAEPVEPRASYTRLARAT